VPDHDLPRLHAGPDLTTMIVPRKLVLDTGPLRRAAARRTDPGPAAALCGAARLDENLGALNGAWLIDTAALPQRVERKIRIWKIPASGLVGDRWIWHCTRCEPAVTGCVQSWDKALRNSRRHCARTRFYHHAHVRIHYGPLMDLQDFAGHLMAGDLRK
jgi:hypothetical protein